MPTAQHDVVSATETTKHIRHSTKHLIIHLIHSHTKYCMTWKSSVLSAIKYSNRQSQCDI